MKTNIIFLIFGVFLGFLIFKNCENKTYTKIEIPAKTGIITSKDSIVYVPIETPVEVPKWYKDTAKEKELLKAIEYLKIDTAHYKAEFEYALSEFQYADSIAKAEKFKNAILPKKFIQEFKDSLIKIHASGVVTGEIKDFNIIYKLEQQNVKIPTKKGLYSIAGGLGTNPEQQPIYKIGLGFKNIEIDYITNKTFFIGYRLNF